MEAEGWRGWDDYAAFYDWENARTLGRRDVAFWQRIAAAVRGPILELGCGTGRVSMPLVRAGAALVGVDRSASMLTRAVARARRLRTRSSHVPRFVRGDITSLPFADRRFAAVLAPYGILQSILSDRDLDLTLACAARVLKPGGRIGIDLVPDVPRWAEYRDRVRLRGRAPGGAHVTLIESVRQDRRRRLTTFEQTFVERRRGQTREHRFALTFRTLTVPQIRNRLEAAGFVIDAVLGDYRGRPWDKRAEVWIILASRS